MIIWWFVDRRGSLLSCIRRVTVRGVSGRAVVPSAPVQDYSGRPDHSDLISMDVEETRKLKIVPTFTCTRISNCVKKVIRSSKVKQKCILKPKNDSSDKIFLLPNLQTIIFINTTNLHLDS